MNIDTMIHILRDNPPHRSMIVPLECYICSTVNWELQVPVTETFIQLAFVERRKLSPSHGSDHSLLAMARFICQVGIVHGGIFCTCPPSVLADCGLYLAEKLMGRNAEAPLGYICAVSDKLEEALLSSPKALMRRHYVLMRP